MQNHNKLSVKEYILETCLFCIIFLLLFKDNLPITDITFLITSVGFVILTTIITYKNRRNTLNAVCNAVLPFEIFLLLSLNEDLFSMATSIITIMIVLYTILCIMCSVWFMVTKLKTYSTKKIVNRLILNSRGIILIVLTAFIIPTAIITTIEKINEDKEFIVFSEEYMISNNIDVICNFQEDVWSGLTTEEKIYSLQTIADIEVSRLGLPHQLTVRANTMSEILAAQYTDKDHVIEINITYLDESAENLLNSVCHEAFHAFENRLVEAYNSVDKKYCNLRSFYHAEDYKNEFDNYVDADCSTIDYYFQTCEIDAREYGEKEAMFYCQTIKRYFEEYKY